MSGQFEIGIAVRPDADVSQIQPGAPVVLKINGQTVITGHLDALTQHVTDKNKDIKATGRDKTADLVDCSVLHQSYHLKIKHYNKSQKLFVGRLISKLCGRLQSLGQTKR